MKEPVPSQAAPLPSQQEDELSWAEEFQEEPQGLRPSLRFFVTMAIVGVLLAFGWRYTGIAQQVDQLWSSVTSVQAAAPAGAKLADEPLAPIMAELNSLKSEIARLSVTNQQMAATIASLQAQQRELQQRVAAPYTVTHLFSDPKLLQMRIVAGHRPVITGSTARRTTTTTAPGRSEMPNRPVPRPDGAPMALAPPN